jgi:hypothetical protein
MTRATAQEWYRFLDVASGEDAADEMRRLVARLEVVHHELESAARLLSDAPEGEVRESLWIARTGLDDAMDQLELAGSRFWASERQEV